MRGSGFSQYRLEDLRELRQIELGSDPLTICRKDYHFGVVRGNLVPVVVQNNVEAKVRVADRVAAEDWYAGKLQGFDEPVPLELPGIPVFRSYTVGDAYFGFDVVLHYDGDEIAPDNAKVVVLTADGQRIAAEFDLAKLP